MEGPTRQLRASLCHPRVGVPDAHSPLLLTGPGPHHPLGASGHRHPEGWSPAARLRPLSTHLAWAPPPSVPTPARPAERWAAPAEGHARGGTRRKPLPAAPRAGLTSLKGTGPGWRRGGRASDGPGEKAGADRQPGRTPGPGRPAQALPIG